MFCLLVLFLESCIPLTNPDNTTDYKRLWETMVSYSLGRSLHQSGLDSAASHHRRM